VKGTAAPLRRARLGVLGVVTLKVFSRGYVDGTALLRRSIGRQAGGYSVALKGMRMPIA
jgi:hypothetical protein